MFRGAESPQVAAPGKKLKPYVRESEALSSEGKAAINKLKGSNPLGWFSELLFVWITIVAIAGLAVYVGAWWFTILAMFLVATRQKVIGLLMHEQAHQLGIFAPWGDYIANIFVAYPMGITIEGYRRVHLSHHSYFFGEKDPDYMRKQGAEWTFPQKVAFFLKTMFRDFIGLNALNLLKSKTNMAGGAEFDRTNPGINLALRVTFYALAIVVFTTYGLWWYFLLYWLIPLLTFFQVIFRWSAIMEHKYDLVAGTHVEEATPMIMPTLLEQLLFPELNFNYHVYHHRYVSIPFSRLPKVDAVYRKEGLTRDEVVFRGYVQYLRYILHMERHTDAHWPGNSAAYDA